MTNIPTNNNIDKEESHSSVKVHGQKYTLYTNTKKYKNDEEPRTGRSTTLKW